MGKIKKAAGPKHEATIVSKHKRSPLSDIKLTRYSNEVTSPVSIYQEGG
jgi:hypothetical protein